MARHIKFSLPTREAYTSGVRFSRVANALPDKQLTSPPLFSRPPTLTGATDFINVVLTPTNVQVHLAPDDSASAARLAALKHRLPFEAIASSLYAETGVETVETPPASRAPL